MLGGVFSGGHARRHRALLDQEWAQTDWTRPQAEQVLRWMSEAQFVELQRRRSQTEGRVAILKNGFLGRPLRAKGFDHREQAVSWQVLTHNLWVLARLEPKPEMALAA